MPHPVPGTKQYALIGRRLEHENPMLFSQLYAFFSHPPPEERPLAQIDTYLKAFCLYKGITPPDITGPVYKSGKVYIRRIFIAVILKLYHHQNYISPLKGLQVRDGVTEQLAKTLLQKRSNMSTMVRQVIEWARIYTDFKTEVDSITQIIRDAAGE